MTSLKFIVKKIREKYLFGTITLIAIGLSGQVFLLLNPWIVGKTISAISAQSSVETFWKWPALALLTWLLTATMNALFQLVDLHISGGLHKDICDDLFSRLLMTQTKMSAGTASSYVRDAADSTADLYNIVTFDFTRIIVLFIGAILILGSLHFGLVVALIVWSYIFVRDSFLASKKTSVFSKDLTEKRSAVSDHFIDAIKNIALVKSHLAEQHERQLFEKVTNQEFKSFKSIKKYLSGVGFRQMAFKALFTGGLFALTSIECSKGHIDIGNVAMVLQLSLIITDQTESFSLRLLTATRLAGAVQTALDKMHLPIEQLAFEPKAPIKLKESSIELRNITFGYQSDKPLLKKANLIIRPGEFVVLTGPSGAGKSSVIHLLKGRIRPISGQILLGGKDLSFYSNAEINALTKEVLQEAPMFNRSLVENIFYNVAISNPATKKVILGESQLDEVLKNKAGGIEFIVGENGSFLSGGEKQRVALARLFAQNSNIIFLDEITSALDESTERKIVIALKKLLKGKTVLAITHRKEILSIADKVYKIEDGKFRTATVI